MSMKEVEMAGTETFENSLNKILIVMSSPSTQKDHQRRKSELFAIANITRREHLQERYTQLK